MAVTPTAVPKNKHRSVLFCFLTLKNVSGSEIHTRMCMVGRMLSRIQCKLMDTEIQGKKQTSTSDKP